MSDITVYPFANEKIPIARAVAHNGLVHVSGQVGFKPGTMEPISDDVREQARETFRVIDGILAETGSSVRDLVKVNVYLVDVERDFAAMNEVFVQWVGDHRPARTTIGCGLAIPGLLIEVDCTAVIRG